MSAFQQEIVDQNLQQVFSNDYVAVYTDASKRVLVCQTLASYIPIHTFKASFLQCSGLIAKEGIERFIFDKRSLRAFHQPSMEWYFVNWKQEMYHEHGLRIHRKILPQEQWFQKCVEAGRHEIEQRHPENIFSKLDITYTGSIAEALHI
ncbi:hypothetical protein [Cesiribacter sp. SM1]|uniref:hypothetical protein n=1 Tax=Cesiribacter sp. SM1 TaxID=2861196 RepID=UPI001CD79FB6|nr:hypothetical protein [Cesiribacter sp. SM1]